MDRSDLPNARELKDLTRPQGIYWVHRHSGEEEHGERHDCWCHPLRLTHEQIVAMNTSDLQDLLDQHFNIQ